MKKRGFYYIYFWPRASFVVYVLSVTHKIETKRKCINKSEHFISKNIFGKNGKNRKSLGGVGGGDYLYFLPKASCVVYVWRLTYKFEAKRKFLYKREYFISKKIF